MLFGVILLVCIIWIIWTFNRTIRLNNLINEAWSDIEVQLKRRYDLIPNLVDTVKAYARHEQKLFERLARERTKAFQAQSTADFESADMSIRTALKSLLAVAENYPQLRANENFTQLQTDLTETEDKLESARRFYNGAVRDLNIVISSFPQNLVAGLLGIKQRHFFEVENAGERIAPKVSQS